MDVRATHCGHDRPPADSGATIPALERLCYFFGQMLEPADFRAEQSYFATLLSLLARHGVGWGVACGLDVGVGVGAPDGCGEQPERERLVVTVTRGIAIDCRGRLIVLRRDWRCRLSHLLDEGERSKLLDGAPVFIWVEHAERPVHPSRGIGEDCDPLTAVQFGRIRDEPRIVVSLLPPEPKTCDACLGPCSDPRVLLASAQLSEPEPSAAVSVRPELRRLLARAELTTITAVGWVHGGTYERRSAERLLGAGVGVRFSRPVRSATLREGVVDLVVYEGGGGRRDAWYFKGVELDTGAQDTVVSEVTVRISHPEGFQEGDRILLRLRCDFVLDECCRAVSGAHLGGGVRFDQFLDRSRAVDYADDLVKHPDAAKLPCPHPPARGGPWWSGNGVEGGTWESWIHVGPNQDPYGTPPEGRPR